MSILIKKLFGKDMPMPQEGYIDVRLHFWRGKFECATMQTGESPFYATFDVEEVPPHGDLIDRDETVKAIGGRPHVGIGINDDDDEFESGMSCQWGRDTGTIKDMPAIIKAEGSENE